MPRGASAQPSPAFDRVFDFSGKTVLVTGAANGIGLAISELFAERGARFALIDGI
jgi:NAD(P)-dependent dehydrogenase (short-subunit alcohol dehydrogenase family)